MTRLLRAIARHPLLLCGIGAMAGYGVLVFATFFWQNQDRLHGDGFSVLWSSRMASFQPQGDGFEGFHDLVLQSVNPATGDIRGTYSVHGAGAHEFAYVCPWFGHEDLDLGGSSSWVEQTEITLTKRQVGSPFGERLVAYEGDFVIHPVLKPDRFPFDAIVLEVNYEPDGVFAPCKDKAGAQLRPPRMLDITCNIPGFVVGSRGLEFSHSDGRTTMRLQLTRSSSLRWTAILLACLGFVSTLLVVRRMWRKGTEDWTPLAYFVALWGSRSILLTLIPEPRPFPTLVDATVLYLFALAFGGWVTAHVRASSVKRMDIQ